MDKQNQKIAALKSCPNCAGQGRVDVIRTAIRGNGTKVVVGHVRERCPTCTGSGRIKCSGARVRYFMIHNMTDGSIAAMATSASPWQVLAGPNGRAPTLHGTSAAADFVRQQNKLRHRRILIGLSTPKVSIKMLDQESSP